MDDIQIRDLHFTCTQGGKRDVDIKNRMGVRIIHKNAHNNLIGPTRAPSQPKAAFFITLVQFIAQASFVASTRSTVVMVNLA